ncbi:CBS domain-containing protein [Defluviimonas salinarum]|uniref:CBS domain-containing protein n=1 Tax=Defluviimonas salinarum TaxID=2992147 RepID=A0ABT3J850_9RHOB|nr:CBS domain-containing protein [Defluviimonas salinarum]MCW3783862.1 CBS domain-containing protein [Defluviimonas salinarum]
MRVGDILKEKSPEIFSVTPDRTLVDVLRLFAKRNIGFVLVGNTPGEYQGTLSERDCCNAMAERGADAAQARAGEIMKRDVPTCSASDLLPLAMAIMTRQRTRHVIVLDDGKLVGIVSIGDVVKHRLDEALRTEQELEEYVAGKGYH